MKRLLPWLLLPLAGCALVDQDTFAPAPEPAAAKPAAAAARAPAAEARRALVTIDFLTPAPHYRDLLGVAVRAAEARDPAVQYDVIGIAANSSAAAGAQDDAGEVMRAIMAERVPASRIHLGLRIDPSLTAPQVRVYVR